MSKKDTRTEYAIWLALFAVGILSVWAVGRCPYFPGDVTVERCVQSLVPGDLAWARGVSTSAEFPWLLVVLAIVAALSWAFAGWRAGLFSIVSLAGMLALGMWLGPVVGRPRPSPELVHVAKQLSGYSFPSLFALRYAATFGFLAILAIVKTSGTRRAAIPIVCAALLVIGFLARIALAAHWPSDVVISYYLGLLWAALLVRVGVTPS